MIDYRIATVMEANPSHFQAKKNGSQQMNSEIAYKARGTEFDDMLQDCIKVLREQDEERKNDDEYV